MKPVEREEILGLAAYEQIREPFRRRISELKRTRRVALGPNMTVLFENRDTVLFQIQEMLRTERITSESGILHELRTYNELVPGDRELSATIFIEYPEREERERMLRALAGVEDGFSLEVAGERLPATPDPRERAPDLTMAVQYVKFPLTAAALAAFAEPGLRMAVRVDHPAYRAEAVLAPAMLESLREDLRG